MGTFLIVAYKLNDIYYAQSTEEYKNSKNRVLIAFCAVPANEQQHFSTITHLEYARDFAGILRSIILLIRLKKGNARISYICSSNFQLFYSRLISTLFYPKPKLILIEDGLMNYRTSRLFMPNSSLERIPKLILKALNIEHDQILKRIHAGYFLNPKKVNIEIPKRQLDVRQQNGRKADQLAHELNGKSIFIGQPLYKSGGMPKERYVEILKTLQKKSIIDVYIPHLHEDKIQANIKTLNVADFDCTLETIAKKLNAIKIVTFSSSLAYTLPSINSNIQVSIISTNYYNNEEIKNLFRQLVNNSNFSQIDADDLQ